MHICDCGKKHLDIAGTGKCHKCREDEQQMSYGARAEVTKYKRKKRPVLETEAQQREIREAIAAKQKLTFESKRYRPGDPDFEKIAAQCTPPSRIKFVAYAPYEKGGIVYGSRAL